MMELGRVIAQMYLNPFDKIIGIIGAKDSGKSMLIQNCGLPEETVYADLSQSRPEGKHGYFSTVIVKG